MATIAVTPDDATAVVQVDVDVFIGDVPAGTALGIVRVDDTTGQVQETIAVWNTTGDNEQITVYDAAVPLGVPHRWRVVSAFSILALSAPATVNSTGCWLTYGTYPYSTLQVELQAWPTDVLEARGTDHRVIGRPDVVSITDVWDLPAGELSFLARTLPAATTLTRALTSGTAALLRTQPGSDIVQDLRDDTARYFFTPRTINRSRLSGRSPDGRRLVAVNALGTRPYATAATLPWPTLGQVAAEAATLEGLAALGATLADVAVLPNA